ncbi:MAG: hypothetical protein GY778_28650 [bacterium]|nr:hypothetical protein [bacterium]
MPPALAARVARFHLVDNVRGQALPFIPKEVIEAAISTERSARDGSRVTLKISGHTRAKSEGDLPRGDTYWTHETRYPHGVTTELLGRADYDLDTRTFTQFELVALGRRWGRTRNNARSRQLEASPIGFYFTLTPSGPEAAVPPAYIDVYNADWVVRPNSGPAPADKTRGGR